ncbi:MAG: response regulator [Bdellovibrionaceae bacterium]|nr:response regulator [Pseudobdellovibrionaceae bacterium]|tara:strand:+ start:3018 stop:3416 length:399 start_codon:yes stop_codon:yes gene_type:complete
MELLKKEVEILVVDDVMSIRVQIRDLLKNFGFQQITLVSSGPEAMKHLKEHPVHIVLCDWRMEIGDGLELLGFIRSEPKLKDLPFVMVTAENTKERVIEAIQKGVDSYLVKPITVQQVQDKVFSVLIDKKVI